MTGLHARIQNNNLRSLALFALFFLAAEALTVLLLATLLAEGAWRSQASVSPFTWLRLVFVASWTGRAWLFHFSGYVCWLVVAWAFYRAVVKRSLDLRPLDRAAEAEAWHIAEAAAISAGLPTLRLYVMETEGRNAFAFGLMASDAAIVLSRGLLRALNARELQAVVAHELAHIRAGDVRLMAVATLCAGLLFRVAWVQIAIFIQPSPQWLFLPLFAARFFWTVVLLALWSCAALGVCVVMARLAISHAREFKADAEAVDLTGDPEALISALRKLEGGAEIPGADFAVGAAMIVSPRATIFGSHPPIADRVAALRAIFPMAEGYAADAPTYSARPAISAPARQAFGQRGESLAGRWGFVEDFKAARRELRAIRPPKWISHPYILLPAIALNLAIGFAFGPSPKDLGSGRTDFGTARMLNDSLTHLPSRDGVPVFVDPGHVLHRSGQKGVPVFDVPQQVLR